MIKASPEATLCCIKSLKWPEGVSQRTVRQTSSGSQPGVDMQTETSWHLSCKRHPKQSHIPGKKEASGPCGDRDRTQRFWGVAVEDIHIVESLHTLP